MKRSHSSRIKWILLLAGLVGTAALMLNFTHMEKSLFFRAYLFSFLFALGLALGSLALIMLHNLTGGAWGDAIRPTLHAAALTLPVLALLFIPIAANLAALYPWARSDATTNTLLLHRAPYLNATFFVMRATVYFAVWITLALLLSRGSPVNRALNAAGLILYLFTMTHAGFDWIMSRDTDFHSTAFGFVVTLGQTLSAIAFAVLFLPSRADRHFQSPPAQHAPGLLNDLGNILLTLVVLWMYVAFMQFLVVWMGNSRNDNSWYLQRGMAGLDASSAAWRITGLILILFHFFIPFFLLLFRSAKQYRPMLFTIAGLLLGTHVVEEYWLIAPSDKVVPQFSPNRVDVWAFITIGSLWLFVLMTIRSRRLPALHPPHSYEEVPASD